MEVETQKIRICGATRRLLGFRICRFVHVALGVQRVYVEDTIVYRLGSDVEVYTYLQHAVRPAKAWHHRSEARTLRFMFPMGMLLSCVLVTSPEVHKQKI